MSNSSQTILLVEDDPNDVFFLQYAFEQAGIANPLQVVGDGQQALDYLQGQGRYSDRAQFPFPCLVLLDLKLPVRMGLDVLRAIQQRPELQSLLVIVLSSSADQAEVDQAYQLGARSYLIKPLSVETRSAMARLIKSYWLELNQFPTLGGCAANSAPS